MLATKIRGARRSKTALFGMLIAMVGLVQTAIPTLEIPQQYHGLANVVLGCLIIYMRFVTTESLEEKGSVQSSDVGD